MVRDRRRPRRRRAMGRDLRRVLVLGLVAAAVVAFLAAAVAGVGRASVSFHRTLAAGFAALASPVALRSNATGAELAGVLSRAAPTSRPALFGALDRIAADAADQARQMDAAGSPPTAGGTSAGCVDAMDARANAAAAVRDALEGLLGGRTGSGAAAGDQPSAVRGLDAAGSLLLGADRAWASCRAALVQQSRAARVPKSVWVGDVGTWDPGAVADGVAAFAALRSLQAVPHLSLGPLSTEPPAVAGSGGAGVLPPTTAVVLRVVVTNDGNVDEHGVRVGATATAAPGGPPVAAAVSTTVDIDAGQAAAVTLPAIRVQPGAAYTFVVSARDAAGAASASTSLTLTVASPPPTTTTTTTTTTIPTTTTTKAHTTTTAHALRPLGRQGGTTGPPAP